MGKRKRGSRRGARGKSFIIHSATEESDTEPDCVEEVEEEPASSSQGSSSSQIEIVNNDFLNYQKRKQTDSTVISSVSNKAPKLRRTSARVFGKISLEDAFNKTSDTENTLSTNASCLPIKCEGNLLKENDVEKSCITSDNKSALIDLNSEAYLKSVMSPMNNKEPLNINKHSTVNDNVVFESSTQCSDVLKKTVTDTSLNKTLNIKVSNEQSNAIGSLPSKSKVLADNSEVEVIYDKKLNDTISKSYNTNVFEEEDEEELIYEDLNDQGTEKDDSFNISKDESSIDKIDSNTNENVDKNAPVVTAKSKILTNLSLSSINRAEPKAEQKDEKYTVNIIDIEFRDLDLEKEFKTESGHNSLKNEFPSIQPLNNSNMIKGSSAKKLVNCDSDTDTKSNKEPIKSTKIGSPKKIQSTTPVKNLSSCIKKGQSTLMTKAVIPKKNLTNSQVKNDNPLSSSNSTSPSKKATTVKKAPVHIPGASFIIGIKGGSKDGKNLFDCVLCNEKSTTFNGATMYTHVKSRGHILNAMEIQNCSLFKKCKDDIDIAADKLLAIMIDYEKTQKKQFLAISTSQNYGSVRKTLAENIKKMKESINRKIEKEAMLDKKKSDFIKKQDNLKEIAKQGDINVKRIYKEELHELANLQSKRSPQNIVLILDEREELIKNMPQRGTNFFTLYDPIINFTNAFEKMQKHAYFNKGTAFIFLGETFEFLHKKDLPDCYKNNCIDPVKIVDISGSKHIERAITLHKKLLQNTENDILLFTGLMPVHIFAYNTSAVNKRSCIQIHDGDIPRSCSNKLATEAYTVMLGNFNAFVEEHSKVLELPKLNFELAYFKCPVNERKNNFFARDGFTYLANTLKDRQSTTFSYIKGLLHELEQRRRKMDHLKIKSSDKPSGNLKEKGDINVKRIYKEELHELATLQLERTPQNIVLILDEREELIKNMPQRGTNFYTLYDPIINFNNAFGKMQKHAYFNKGTAFIFLGETFEFLNKKDLPDCSKNNCLDPVKIVDISGSKHIEQAITLHKNLLKNTENDILLFTGLMPVHIFAYNTSVVKNRSCIHDGDIPRSSSNKIATEAYTDMLSNFNAFVAEHSRVLEYPKLNFELAYFRSPANKRKNNFFARDGFTYVEGTLKERQITTFNYIKGLLRKLEQRRSKMEYLKAKSNDKPFGNLKEKDEKQSSVKAMEAHRDRVSKSQERSKDRNYHSHERTDRCQEKSSRSNYSKEKTERSRESFKERAQGVKIPLLGDFPKLPQPNGPKYEKVVILANNLYEPLLKEFQSERVIVMAEEDLSCNQLKSYFLRKKVLMPSNTLWLSATGIFSIANCETSRTCIKENCYFPLRSLVPCNDMKTVHGAATVIRELADVMTETIKEIKTVMSTDSDFMIIPPIPVSIINESSGIHLELHSLVQKHPNYFVGTESDIAHINIVYKVLCKEISSASLRECHLPFNSAHACLHSDFSIEVVDLSNLNDNIRSFHVWKETIMNFISDALSIQRPRMTDSNKVEEMDIEEEEDIMPSRIVIFDDCKTIDDRERSFKNKRSGAFPESSLNKAISNTKFLFDKLVFLGSENVLKYAVKPNENVYSSIPQITFFEIKNPVYWAEFIKQCKVWKSSGDRILFIFVPDISMIANDVKDSHCSRWKCKHYLTPRCLSKVGQNVIVFQSLVNGIMDLCLDKSKLILTPIFPRPCIQKTLNEDRAAHLQIHKAMIHRSKPLLLEGARSKWIDASDSLEKAWNISNSKIEADDYGVKDILTLIQNQKKIYPIEWKHPDSTSMDCASFFEGKWREFLKDAIEISLKIKKMVRGPKLDDLSSDDMHTFKCDNRQTQIVEHSNRYPADQMASLGNECSYSHIKIPPLMSLSSSDLPHPSILQAPVPFLPPSASTSSHPNSFHQSIVTLTHLSQTSSLNDHSQSASSFIGYKPADVDNRNFNSGGDVIPSYGNVIDAPHGSSIITPSNNIIPSPLNKVRPSLLPDPPGFEKYSSVRQSVDKAPEPFPYRKEIESQQSSETPFLDIGSNLNYEDFLSSLANVCDSFSHPPVFERVVFVGKKEIVEPLLKINVESSAIYHNLANIEESDTQGVLLKLGKISPRTLCCLVFGLSVITKTQPISSTCSNFNCKQPVPITVLKSFNKKGLDLHNMSQGDVISNRLQSVVSFVKCMSKYVPVIVLPLYPSRIYCDNGIKLSSHNISHALQGHDNYVVSGNNIMWNQYFMSLTYIWNNLLEDNHKEYQSSLLIAKYIERQPTFFSLRETVDDFFTHWTEPTVWKTFSEAVLQSLVLLKSLDSNKSASFRDLEQKTSIAGPLARAPTRNSRFSDKERNPNLPATVKIWNLSDCIPHTFFSDLFKAVDASAQVAANKDNYVVEFGKRNGAELLACKLNECQIGNTTLKAIIIGEEGVMHKLNKIQDTFITYIFNQIYAKWKYLMIETIKKKMNSVVDVTNFKTNKCNGNCVGFECCINYHDADDKRRNPLQCKYSQKMCMRARNPLGYCNLGDSCDFSHNIYEQMFFPTNFQTILCPSNSYSSQCSKKPVCKFAHMDSPEMFYNSVWEDVVVFGTNNTIEYFAGAIRGLSKISLNKGVYKVLLISPSAEFLDVAEKSVSTIMKNHRVKATTLADKWVNLDNFQVFLGTPAALASSQNQIFSGKTGGAVIVDDIKRIIGENPDGDVIHKFIHKLKVTTAATNNVNKVFVSSLYDDTITGVLSRFFGLKLKEVRQPEPVKDSGVPPLITLGDSPPRHRSSKKSKSPLQIRPFSPPRRNQSPTRESIRGQKRPSERSRDRRSRSRSRSRTKKFKDTESSPISKPKKPVSEFHSDSIVPSGSKYLPQIDKQNTILMNCDDENLRIRLGSQLYESFLKEEKIEMDKFEEEYKVYKDVSELHPDYEIYFEDFISKYNIKNRYKGEKHKESLWLQFWKVKFPEIKQTDWELVRKDLVKSYETKILPQTSFSNHGTREAEKRKFDPDTFSLETTLNLLERFCDKIGMLGPALQAMITSSRNLGINTKKALEVFTNSENKLLINMVLDKLRNMLLESPRNVVPIFQKALDWTEQLLEVAEKCSEKKGAPLDLDAIAKASVGKDSNFIVELIKSALAYEGNSFPTKETVNELFLKVCSIHFNMAMQ